jgi:hypothetical protein
LSDPGEPDPEIRDALRAILASQDDVRSVVAVGVHRRLLGRSLTGTLFDLGGAGWETVRHLLTNPPSDADMEDDREVPTNEIDP